MMTLMNRQHATSSFLTLAGALALLTSLVTFVSPAFAHAIVMASNPPAGASLAVGNQRCELRFNNRIDRKRSRLVLAGPLGSPGAPVPEQALAVLDSSGEDVLVAELKFAAPGQYRLRWQVLALDGHVTRGEVPFTVGPASR